MQSAPPARATHPAPRARQALTDFTLMADAPTPGQLDPNWDASKAFMGTSNWNSVCRCGDETARTTARAGSAARTLFVSSTAATRRTCSSSTRRAAPPKGSRSRPFSKLLERWVSRRLRAAWRSYRSSPLTLRRAPSCLSRPPRASRCEPRRRSRQNLAVALPRREPQSPATRSGRTTYSRAVFESSQRLYT